jgi:hypothetical protein
MNGNKRGKKEVFGTATAPQIELGGGDWYEASSKPNR